MEKRPFTATEVSRRRVLRRGGAALVGTIALAGCTEDVGEELPANKHWPSADLVPDLPVRERTELLETGIEASSDADIAGVEAFVTVLEEREIEFRSVAEEDDLLKVEYRESDIERRGILEVIAVVAGAYAALVSGEFDGRALEMVVSEADGSTIGVAEIETRWATAYNSGALSAAEYGELVAGTIESKRSPPG